MRGRKPDSFDTADALEEAPPVPEWLSPIAQEEWRKIVDMMIVRRSLTDGDLGTVEMCAIMKATIRECQETLAKEGATVKQATGSVKRHPAMQNMLQAMAELRRLNAELGLSPASRQKARGGAPAEDDFFGLLYTSN